MLQLKNLSSDEFNIDSEKLQKIKGGRTPYELFVADPLELLGYPSLEERRAARLEYVPQRPSRTRPPFPSR